MEMLSKAPPGYEVALLIQSATGLGPGYRRDPLPLMDDVELIDSACSFDVLAVDLDEESDSVIIVGLIAIKDEDDLQREAGGNN